MSKKAETKLIWHYTRIEALKGIINTKIMRATHFNELNDSGEILYGIKKFKELYKDYLNDKKINTLNRYSRVVEDSARVFFIISFSRSIDSLYQWIAYTDTKKGGCAIGFEISDDLFEYEERNPPQHNNCLYTDQQILKRFPQEKLNNDPTLYCWLHPMLFIKHPCFKEEKEYRYWVNDLNKRSVRRTGEPYIDCRIRDLSSIKKIIISPHGDKEKNENDVKKFLQTKLLDNIEVQISELPYIGKKAKKIGL